MWKSWKHKSDNLLLAAACSDFDVILKHAWYNWKSFSGCEFFKTVRGSIEPLAILGKVCSDAKKSKRMSWAHGIKRNEAICCLISTTNCWIVILSVDPSDVK